MLRWKYFVLTIIIIIAQRDTCWKKDKLNLYSASFQHSLEKNACKCIDFTICKCISEFLRQNWRLEISIISHRSYFNNISGMEFSERNIWYFEAYNQILKLFFIKQIASFNMIQICKFPENLFLHYKSVIWTGEYKLINTNLS